MRYWLYRPRIFAWKGSALPACLIAPFVRTLRSRYGVAVSHAEAHHTLALLLLILLLAACEVPEVPQVRIVIGSSPIPATPPIMGQVPATPLATAPVFAGPKDLGAFAESNAYRELPEITVSTAASLVVGPGHTGAVLSSRTIPVDSTVKVLARDADGAWLLVLDGGEIGWLPTLYSRTGTSTLSLPTVPIDIQAECARFLGAVTAAGHPWENTNYGPVLATVTVFKTRADAQPVELALETDGSAHSTITAPARLSVASAGELLFLSTTLTDVPAGTTITLRASGLEEEAAILYVAYFASSCPNKIAATIDLKGFEFIYVQVAPNLDAAEVGRIYQPDEPFYPTALSPDHLWVYVTLTNGVTGWIAREFVVSPQLLDSLPERAS